MLQGNTLADGGPDGPGRLQAELAPFLKRCPYGIVMLEGLQDVHPDLVKVFNHALTEEVGPLPQAHAADCMTAGSVVMHQP